MKSLTRLRILIKICFLILCMMFLFNLFVPSRTQTFGRRYTFVCPLQWDNIARGIREADREFSVNTKLIGMSELDAGKQAQAINEAVLAKVDGIITAGMEESAALKEAIDNAQAHGIPVVLLDNDMPDTSRTCYIGTDNYEAGRLAGEEMYKLTKGKARIGVIVSSLQSPNQQERIAGFEEVIKDYPDMEIVEMLECHSEKLEAKEKVPGLLKEEKAIDALYITEAIAGTVVGDLLKENQITSGRMRIVAFDWTNENFSYIQEGIYQKLIVQAPYLQGYRAVELLNDILDGKKVEDVIYTECSCMDQENGEDEQEREGEELEWHMY